MSAEASSQPRPMDPERRGAQLSAEELFEAIMMELERIPGLLAAMMFSDRGELLGSRVRPPSQEGPMITTGLQMSAMLEAVAGQHGIGGTRCMVIEGDHGRIALLRGIPNTGHMLIAGTPELNVVLAGIALRDVVERLSRSL